MAGNVFKVLSISFWSDNVDHLMEGHGWIRGREILYLVTKDLVVGDLLKVDASGQIWLHEVGHNCSSGLALISLSTHAQTGLLFYNVYG